MNHSDFDWQAYVLDEMEPAERARADAWLLAHPESRAQVEELELTLAALRRLPQVEPPRRIAFVSDPILEPNWWQRFWAQGPRLAFAGAAMLSVAILVHAFVPRPEAPAVGQDQIRTEVARAVAAVRAEDHARFEQVKREILAEAQAQRQADLTLVREAFQIMEKRLATAQSLAVRYGGD